MSDSKSFFNEYIKPFVVLTVICIVVSFLLAYTNSITAPIIEENARIEAERVRSEVLSSVSGGATLSFDEIDCDTDALGIDSAYRESSGLGYVITASYKGYGGLVTATVGLDNDGKIVGLNVDVSTETTGVGSKAGQESFTSQFVGLSGNCDSVDTISNATYSSSAVKKGVNSALAAFDSVKG